MVAYHGISANSGTQLTGLVLRLVVLCHGVNSDTMPQSVTCIDAIPVLAYVYCNWYYICFIL